MSAAIVETLKMIKIEHSIFALPFALVSAFLAAGGMPPMRILALILCAMVLARSAAMAFNRYVDAELDAANPRTALRSIPAGRLSRRYAVGFTLVCSLLFFLVAWQLNPLALSLAPFMLAILLGYSLTKRFTAWCHIVLGLALGLSPLGAWVAVRGEFSWIPVLLGLAVMGWTAGFDIIYACQDIAFDRKHRLHSIPTRLGVKGALLVSRLLHVAMITLLGYLGHALMLPWPFWIGLAAVFGCLIYEHALVWGGDLTKVDMAFFTMNGVVSLVFGAMTITGILIQ